MDKSGKVLLHSRSAIVKAPRFTAELREVSQVSRTSQSFGDGSWNYTLVLDLYVLTVGGQYEIETHNGAHVRLVPGRDVKIPVSLKLSR